MNNYISGHNPSLFYIIQFSYQAGKNKFVYVEAVETFFLSVNSVHHLRMKKKKRKEKTRKRKQEKKERKTKRRKGHEIQSPNKQFFPP